MKPSPIWEYYQWACINWMRDGLIKVHYESCYLFFLCCCLLCFVCRVNSISRMAGK